MRSKFVWLTISFLALATIPANAQSGWTYDNGPISGASPCAFCAYAWTINFGYVVSDTFIAGGYTPVNSFAFGAWEFPGDKLSSVDWSITSSENGGTVLGSGTASGHNLTDQFVSTNWYGGYGYDIDLITVTGLEVYQTQGTYWLNLQNAVVPSGDPVYWDQNSGQGCRGTGCPSLASESATGTIPSESFTVISNCTSCGCDLGACSLGPGSTPEPSSIILFGSGVLGLFGVLSYKLK